MKDFTFDFQRFSGDDTTIEITATTPHPFDTAGTYTIKIGNNTYEIICTAGTTISTNSSGDVIVDGGNVSSTSTDIPFALTSGGTGTFTFSETTARTFKIDDKSYTITLNSGSTTISTNADGDVVVDGGNIKSVRDSEGKHVQFTLNNGIYTTNSDSSIDDSIIYLGDATNKVKFDARYSQNNSESYPEGETKVTVTKYTSNNTYGVTVLTNPAESKTSHSIVKIGFGYYWYTGKSKGKSFDVTLDSDGYTYFNFSGDAPNGYDSLTKSTQDKDFAFRFIAEEYSSPFFIPTGSSPITLRYKDENLYLGNLSSGNNNFKAYSSLNNNATYITYTVGDGIVMATKSDSDVTKYWSTPGYYNDEVFNANTYVLWSDLNYDNSSANLTSLLSTTNEILTIAQTVLDSMESENQDSMFIVKDAIEIIDKGETLSIETIQNKTYGTLTRTSDTSCEVKYSDNKLALTGIEIEDGLTVKIAAHFTDIPIKYTAGTVASNFANLDSVNAYTVSSLDGGAISIGSSTAISLGNGSIRTDQEAQSIGAGNYSVSGYDPGAVGDGITVYKSGDEAYVGDIESLEAFNVGDKNYRKTSFGLLETGKESDYPYGTIYKIFNSTVSGDIIQESTYAIAVKLSALDDEDKKYRIIVPQESVGSSETINVLEIGGTNTINSVVYDSETNPQYAFAQITAGDNNSYLLETVSSTGTFSEAVNLISLSGGASSTSINSALTSGVQIYTSTSNNYAKFQVTATNADYVVVSSDTNRTPIISGASKITLPEGTIAPSTGQVVTVGSNEFSLTSTTATTGTLTIAYDGTTATVTAYPGDTFKFREKEFSVTAGDHITFTLTGNELTISNLNNNDAFTYNGYTYTVGSSSFVREKGSTIGLWSKDNSRTVDSVTFTDMTTEGNWDSLVTISASTEDLTVPPTGFESSIRSAIVISKTDNTYGSTYGQIQLKDNGVYTLAKTTGDLGTLQSIIISGTSTSLSLGSSDFTAATYTANGSTFTLADDDTAGYQVTLSGGLAGVDGVSKATLTAGSLRAADSATTYYVNSKAVNSADEVVVIASGNGSISSVGVGEKFSVDSTPYTLTKVGFLKTGYLLRGNNSPDQNINSFNLGDVNGDWVSLAAASNVTINSASPELFIVNDTSNPSIIYAELATASAGHSLTAKTSWNTANKITIDTTTVTMSGGFKAASIAGTSSAANFVVGNLSGSSFTVTDNNAISGGLLLSGLQNITLGAGLVAPSGLKTIVAANQTISNAQDISVSVNGSAITFGDLDAGETFTVGDTAYSLKTGLGLLTEDKYWIANPAPLDNNATVTLSELNNTSNWYNIAAVDSAKNLSVPSASSSTTWIVMSNDRATRYGTYAGSDSSYTLTKGSDDTAWDSANTIVINDKTVSISNAFEGASIKGVQSAATFTVGDSNATYVVTDSTAASITGANTINQSSGTIALSDSAQTINANSKTIHNVSGLINVSVSSSDISFGDLNSGESFNVGDVSYTLRDNGRLQRSDGKLWSGDSITSGGSITASALNTESNWYTLIAAPSGKPEITSSATVPAYIVDSTSNPTKIYGTLTKSGDTYTLTKDSAAWATLSAITIEVQAVTFSSDYVNIPMTAGENQFTVDTATGNFTVSNSTVPSVSTAATALTLTTGSVTGNSGQTITANSIPVVVGENSSVSVTYSATAGVTADDLSAGESVTINGTSYTMTTGSLSVNVKGSGTSSETTVKGISSDDEFKIGTVRYVYTTAGLGKTDENKTVISYIIKQDVAFTEGDLTLDVLQATDEATWLAVSQVTGGNVVINRDLEKSVILINSLTAPTINYGQVVRESAGVYTLAQYDTSTNPELNTIAQELPSKITVEGVAVTINDEFAAIPISATNATGIIVNDGEGIRRTITGTINQFVGSTMTFTPAVGDNFTINGTEYEMGASAVGLINVTDSDIWTDATTTEFVLPSTSNWTNMLRTNASNILDLSAQAPTNGDNIVIDNGANARLATLVYNSNESSYALTAIGSNKVTAIQLPTANITLTANFETTITTGTGTYTIGGKEYNGSNLTIESTSETDSALLSGTVSIAATKSVKPTISDAITGTSGTITATAENGVWQTVGSLDEGDKFEISGVAYEVLGNNTLRRVTSDGSITIYNGKISDDKTLSFSDITAGTYSAMVMLNESNQLDLTTNLNITSTIVVGYGDPTTRIAQLSYNTATGYTLATTDDGNIDQLTAVLLGDAVKTFNTAIDTTVLTDTTTTYLVNDKTFAAQGELSIATGEDSAILTGGKVGIAQGFEVTTRRTSTTETISSTAGDMAVEVNATAATVTISELDSGDSFTLDGTTAYTMTAIGLVSGTRLNSTVTDSVTTADLGLRGKAWKTILAVSDDALTISGTDNTTEVVVADVSGDVAKKYGTLTTTSTTATLTQSDTDSDLDSITVDGVKATLSAKAASATINAGGATFTVTATRNFTVNAATNNPTISNVTAINLTGGTINAPTNIPITASGKTITATSGDMTVDVTSGKVSVNGLATGETFTADDITYRKVSAGLLDVTNQKLIAGVGNSYDFSGDSKRIIAATDGILDLTAETTSADVYDSLTSPTTKLATLTVNNGAMTLTKTADGISDVNIADGADLTIDFAAKVNGSGTLTVNNNSYTGTNLVIDSTATDSTLYSGTATVAKDASFTTTANDTLASSNGTVTAKVTSGNVSTISDIDVNDSFTLGTTTYTETAIGLIDGTNLNPNITTSANVTDLTGSDWKATLQIDGNLTIDSTSGSDVYVVNIPTDKAAAVKYGTLTKSGTAATLTQDNDDSTLTSITVDGVVATLPTTATSATINAGTATFTVTASNKFTIDDTTSNPTISNVTAINLTGGTINAPINIPITAGGKTITATSGDMTVDVTSGKVTINGLATGETFTADDITYRKVSAGLLDVTNQKLIAGVGNSYDFSGDSKRIIAATDGILDLTAETTSADVYDSLTSPTTKLATLTVNNGAMTLNKTSDGISDVNIADGADLTIDFAAKVNGSGTLTVNNKSYTGTDLTIDSTADDSTLYSGTATIAKDSSVTTTGNDTLASSSGTISASVTSGKVETISDINVNDSFTLGTTTYTETAIGLIDGTNLNPNITTSANVTDLTGDDWKATLQIDGNLTIDANTGSDLYVVNIPTDKAAAVKYGTLTKSGTAATLTQDNDDSTLTSITVDGVVATLPTTATSATINAGDATFTVTASNKFTIDDTTDNPTISNVTSITLTSGTINAPINIPVTANGNVVTATSGDMTINVTDGSVTVGSLTTGDTFTVGENEYRKVDAGLLNVTNQQLLPSVTDSYTLGGEFARIIAATNGILDLTSETASADVYDSLTAPTTKLATLTVNNGKATLNKTADGITDVNIASGTDLTIDFAAKVNGSGTFTVNNNSYTGTNLVIDSTATDSTLYSGTATLTKDSSVTTTANDTLTSTNGTITAKVTSGKLSSISDIDVNDSFTLGTTTYTRTAIGLIDGTNLNPNITTSANVTDLTGDDWKGTLQIDGNLTIDATTADDVYVVNIPANKSRAVKYGTIAKTADNAYTMTRAGSDSIPASITVDGVIATLPLRMANANLIAGTATFNVTASKAFTIDDTTSNPTISNVTSITLTNGTINAPINIPVTANGNVVTATAGDMTINVTDGSVTVGSLTTGDTFTVGENEYRKVDAGLLNVTSQQLLPGVEDSYTLGGEFARIIAATNGVLDLTAETASADVYNSLSSPTTKLATLTVNNGKATLNKTADGISDVNIASGTDLTIDFAAKVNGNGTLTVNNKSYTGTDLTIDSTADDSTLYSGTATIAKDSSVTTTANDTLTSTNGTITAKVTSGKVETISDINVNDSFTLGTTTYTQTAIGLIDGANLNPNITTSANVTDLTGDDWKGTLQIDGNLTIDATTADDVYVVNIPANKARAVKYGTIAKTADNAYTMTRAGSDSIPASITVDGVIATLPLRMAGANLIAGDATFTVTASKAFTIDATSTPTISNVTAITLTDGTINAPINIPVTANGNVVTATSGDMTINVTDGSVTVGSLTTGDTFTVGENEYRKVDAGLLNVTNQQLLPSVTDSYTLGGEFARIIAATNGVLDLTNETLSADVYNSLSSPTTKLATLTVNNSNLSLVPSSSSSSITDIILADGAILTVDFDAEISGSGTLTVNGNSYTGTNLIIDSTEDDSTLYSGTATIAKDSSITTTGNDTLTSTNGTITARVSAGNITTIADIDVNDSFTLGTTTYTQTAIGLTDGTKINPNITDSVDVANLSGSDWKNILQSDGSLTIDSTTADDVYVANVPANAANAVRYGALSKSGTSATLTQNDDDVEFDSIAIDGLKVTLSAKTSSAEFTANDATFNVTADTDFIIDATSTPTINHATSINLSDGKINAPIDIPITAGGNIVTATAGKITLDVDSGIVTVGSLNVGDSFTVGDISYTMTTAGLRDNSTQRLIAGTNEDYILGTAFDRVIAVDGTNLDLTNENVNALVVDSLTNPTKNLATLTVTGGRLILNETNAGIESVTLASGADLTIDFDATVTGSGNLTVNGNSFAGIGDLVIEATEDDSTLYSGTIILTAGDTLLTTNHYSLTANNGTFTATATSGNITALDALNPRDSFTLNRKTYTMSNLGLIYGSKIALSLADTSITIADLDTATWTNFIAPTDGTLDISKVTETLPVFDSATTPTEQIASLELGNRTRYRVISLSLVPGSSSITDIIDSVKVAKGTNLTVDFPVTVQAPQGSVTVNNQSFIAHSNVVLNADSNVTVYSGSITLNANNPAATSTEGDIIIVENGSITAKAADGLFTTVSNLKPRDSFTFNGTTYTMTARGIMNGNLICTSLKGNSINLERLQDATWSAVIAPTDGRLDLTNPVNSIVVNDIDNPTTVIATLTVDGTNLSLVPGSGSGSITAVDVASGAHLSIDFNTKIFADGSVTVNDYSFTGSDLVIDSAYIPTLFSGTVTLTEGDTLLTSNHQSLTTNTGELTVTVTPEQITINNFTAGNSFTLNDNSYLVSEIGLINAAGLLWADGDISEGLTADELTDPDNWAKFIIAEGGVLNVDPDTLADGDSVLIVDDDYPTQLYGSLTKSDGIYHLSDPNNILEAINLTGIKIYIDNDLAYVPITTANSDGSETSFTVTPDLTKDSFLVDATGIAPKIDDVISIDIISGKIDSGDGQIVHPADNPTDVSITGGNGTHHIGDETFIVDGLKGDNKVTFYLDDDGNVDSILIPAHGATVTIDGITYTAPADNSTLNYTDADGWYFDDYTLDEYTVTVDADGNITVNAGVKFTDVVNGGRTLGASSTVNLATTKPVTVITARAINVTDSAGNKLADNLTSTSGVKFDSDGVTASDLADVAGAVFTLNAGQSLLITQSGNLAISQSDCGKVSVGADNLTFSAGTYTVNGQTFTASGTTQGTLIDGGIQLNITDPITVGDMTLSGGTAILADDLTLTGGVNVTGAVGETLIVDGVATIDGKTINTDSATAVTCAADGVQIGNTTLTVTGDEAYQINVAEGSITGLENIGSSGGVTVGGLKNATVKTDTASTFTAGDSTFNATNNLTYTISNGEIISAQDLAGTISGDFSGGFTVNGEAITIAGNASKVVGNTSGVTKVETSAQGSFTINGKTYEISGDTSAAFDLTDGTVTGVESLESGNLIFAQDESNFSVNGDSISFSGAPITLGVAGSDIASVSGLNGGSISGLDNATVYGITAATINGTALGISTPYNAAVEGGKLSNLAGITSGTSISSAPSMTVTTAENGDFTFTGDTYTINDTLDGSVDFITDGNTKVIEVANFAGSISGNIDTISLNDKTITSSGESVTITSDGTNITGVKGSSSIGGDIENIDYTISDGSATINGKGFELKGNSTDATIDGSGSVISGIEDYATLTFSEGGTYEVNGETVTVEGGESITINRDGLYKFDGDGVISEKTQAEDIAPAILIEQDSSLAAGNDSVVVRNDASASIDVSGGEPLIIPTSGKVTLENYHDNASVQTPAYNDLTGAIKANEIKFGDGVMTLGDAVVSFSPANESSTGSVLVDLINAQGDALGVGFTNTNGGTVDASSATSDYVVKGNYADSEGDTLKSGGSRLLTGSGNDTILAGGMDSIDAGGGYNVIYLTDETLRGTGIEGATLMISDGGKNTVHNFTDGYTTAADKVYVQDLSALDFSYGAGRLIISTEQGTLTIPDIDDEGGYKLQITDGVSTYNATVAVTSEELTVGADSNANYFYGEAINFSEYTGALEVNLNEDSGYIGGNAAQFHGLSKVTGGSGRTTLIGGTGDETLIAGSGEASIWSNGGNDVMQGSTSADKNSASFYYTAGDGRDTITNFDFANSPADTTSDYVKLADNDAITDVYLSGDNVIIQINNSAQDYLTLMNAKGQSFRLNDDLIAKVDDNVEFDGFSNVYVGAGSNSTLTVGEGFGDVQIWLSDELPEYHGTWYEGTFKVLDAGSAEGNDILAGNQLDNLIIGGSGRNSIWGGYGNSDDTLVGGSGQNTFYYELGNGNDVINNAHDGDIIRLEDVYLDNILSADITSGGVSVDFTGGGSLTVNSNAAVEYRLADGTSYTADHNRKEWNS